MNYELFRTRYDPGDQLDWLEKSLLKLEINGEFALILAHVPPGSHECLYQWAIRYRALMDRF